MMIYTQALHLLQNFISQAQAWCILKQITGQKKETIIIAHTELTTEQHDTLHAIIARLKAHEPVAYIVGTIPFLNLELEIEKPILIPRPETEFFTEYITSQLNKLDVKNMLDLGTGSGCIGLSIAQALPAAHVTCTDISEQACALAQKNKDKNKIFNCTVIQSDLFSNLENQIFDVIVSNPPYIPDTYKNILDASVMQYEDHNALFSGKDGLDIIEKIIVQSSMYLSDANVPFKLALEVDSLHTDKVVQLCLQNKFGHAWIMHDQYNRARFVFAK